MDKVTELNVAALRKNYTKGGIVDSNLPDSPIAFFKTWLDEAVKSEVMEPNAMSLATADKDGTPNVRMVLLKGIEGETIHFYTNYESEKGKELADNPQASVAFWWPELERQVRISGSVEKISKKESTDYFHSRPRESQIGAWSSNQSREVMNRVDLQNRYEKIKKKFEGADIPKPEFWGGYQINIKKIEFWQGRPGRLHDRIKYVKNSEEWTKSRLQP